MNVGERRLYLVQPGGMAIRYAVGVGREEALNFRGSAVIGRKAEWPHWSPTGDMIRRMPIYAHYVTGCRAASAIRWERERFISTAAIRTPISACTEPTSRTRSATKVSSGCIRLFNHDIIDLYNRVPVGAPVVVLQEGESPLSANAEAGGYGPGGYRPGGYEAGGYAADGYGADGYGPGGYGAGGYGADGRSGGITIHTPPDRPGPP